jgi:hypothetical protein
LGDATHAPVALDDVRHRPSDLDERVGDGALEPDAISEAAGVGHCANHLVTFSASHFGTSGRAT